MSHKIQLFILVSIIYMIGSVRAEAQADLIGPIVVGTTIGAGEITVQDIGADQVWTIPLSGSYGRSYNWSPDGCRILLRGSYRWEIFSLPEMAIESLNLASQIAQPIWHPNSKSILFSINKNPDTEPTTFYMHDVIDGNTQVAFTSEAVGFAFGKRWISDTEFLYSFEDGMFVWNQALQEIYPYQSKLQHPASRGWNLPYYKSTNKQDEFLWARFFHIRTYNIALSNPEEYIEIFGPIENIEPQPGFDIYFAASGDTKHIDVHGQFLQSLSFSPSGRFILASTYPPTTPDELNRIYIYDIETDELTSVGNFQSTYNSEYGAYEPSWSSDENILAINTLDGYIIFDLLKNTSTPLDEQFSGFYMSLNWSPIMNYEENQCN